MLPEFLGRVTVSPAWLSFDTMQALEALLNRPGVLEGEGREKALQLWQSLRQIFGGRRSWLPSLPAELQAPGLQSPEETTTFWTNNDWLAAMPWTDHDWLI